MGLSKQLKQIIEIEHNIQLKNPNSREASQLAIHKRGWELELVAAKKQI